MIKDVARSLWALGWIGGGAIAAFVVLLLVAPWVASPYVVSLLMAMFMYIVVCSSWNIISGFTGYVSFGHVVFWGVGAYVTAVLVWKFNYPWPLAVMLGGVGSAFLAAIVSYPILKLTGIYFAISMLALAEAIKILTSHFRSVTGGGGGIYLRPMASLNILYLMMGFLALAVVLVCYSITHTKFGRSLLTIREDETAAESLGINITRRKIQALILSGLFPGIAGGIYVMNVCFINPATAFDISITVNIILMTTFGGIGTIIGPVLGPVAFTALSEFLWASFPFLHRAILGAILIAIVMGMPNGIMPFMVRFAQWVGIREFFSRRREASQ